MYGQIQIFPIKSRFAANLCQWCSTRWISDDGQLWGNPIYDWEEHEATNYEFWINRVKFNLNIFVIRLDHFRGFESFWLVPSNEESAKYGRWEQGPGLII